MSYKFGKHAPHFSYATPRLSSYLTPVLPTPPPSFSVLPQVYTGAKMSDPTELFPMDGNDTIGDCTIAALAHAQTVYRGITGSRCIWGRNDVEVLYFHLTGGQDAGLVELDVLHYWHTFPVNNDRILGYVSIDPRNHLHVQQAINLFGGVYIGFQVQQDCISDFEAGRPWTPGPLLQEGHAVYVVGYDANQVEVLTWGNTQYGTWAWFDECVDECYAIVPPEAHSLKFTPGFNEQQLLADLLLLK